MNPASAAPKLTHQPAISEWLEVRPAPKPYLHVLRRTFRSGLHVLILVQETEGRFQVHSSVDHGTPRGTVIKEGFARDPDGLAELLGKTCAKWIEEEKTDAGTSDKPHKRYFHTKPGGGISEPVSRDRLFHLLAQGVIPWHSQVWEEIENLSGSGGWRPIMTALGFSTDGTAGED